MDIKEILSKVDHTLLSQSATPDDIRQVIDDGILYGTATVCIPPCYIPFAREYAKDNIRLCTVIGFPNGNSIAEAKCFEAQNAVNNGADEIDMVINIGYLKAGMLERVSDEINSVKKACNGRLLKVIIETCLLTDDEKVQMCRIISASNADYIKTSTGFSTGGATLNDITLFKKHVSSNIKIKAAGGIKSIEDARQFILAGADRLGTSRIVKLLKENDNGNTAY